MGRDELYSVRSQVTEEDVEVVVAVIGYEAGIGGFESDRTAIGAHSGDGGRGDRDADPVRIRVQQGRDSRLNIAKIQMVLAGKRIGNEIRTAAKEGNKSTRGVYRRPVES